MKKQLILSALITSLSFAYTAFAADQEVDKLVENTLDKKTIKNLQKKFNVIAKNKNIETSVQEQENLKSLKKAYKKHKNHLNVLTNTYVSIFAIEAGICAYLNQHSSTPAKTTLSAVSSIRSDIRSIRSDIRSIRSDIRSIRSDIRSIRSENDNILYKQSYKKHKNQPTPLFLGIYLAAWLPQ